MARMRIVQLGYLFIPLYMLSSNERDGDLVGSDDVTDEGGAIPESGLQLLITKSTSTFIFSSTPHMLVAEATSLMNNNGYSLSKPLSALESMEKSISFHQFPDALITDTGNEVCFSGPIHIPEPGDKNKLPDTGEAAEASDAQETTEEVHNTHQEQSESLSKFPGRLPSNSQKRRKRRATTRVPGSDTQQETKKRRGARGATRDPNWTVDETQMLIACKSQLDLPKGKQGWEIIAAKIPTRNAKQCRQRWDTNKKSCKNIEDYCAVHGKKLSQVAKEEFLSMNLDMMFFTNGHWYKMINDYYSRTITSSGPAANELNGASTSTHTVGKTIFQAVHNPISRCHFQN